MIYDRDEIQQEINKIEKEEIVLNNFISEFSVNYLVVDYDTAVKNNDYVQDIANILSVGEVSVGERTIKKVSGNVSTVWVDKFKSELSL